MTLKYRFSPDICRVQGKSPIPYIQIFESHNKMNKPLDKIALFSYLGQTYSPQWPREKGLDEKSSSPWHSLSHCRDQEEPSIYLCHLIPALRTLWTHTWAPGFRSRLYKLSLHLYTRLPLGHPWSLQGHIPCMLCTYLGSWGMHWKRASLVLEAAYAGHLGHKDSRALYTKVYLEGWVGSGGFLGRGTWTQDRISPQGGGD